MRFMMFMIPYVYQGKKGEKLDAGFMPDAKNVEKMSKYNEELAKSGALISLDGFHPPINSARISFDKGKPKVSYGSAKNAKNVLGGYWMIKVNSLEKAVNWAKRVPVQEGDVIELRQIFEISEFPVDVRIAAGTESLKIELEKNIKSA